MIKILFTGGGSGGHIFPIIAVARELRRIYPQDKMQFYYIGPKDEFGMILLSQEDFIIKKIISGKIRRYFSWQNFVDIVFKIPFGFIQSFFLFFIIWPDLVFSKGGSGSISVTFASKLLKRPIFVHESDIVPGLSNQKTSWWAKKIFTAFPKTEYFDQEKAIVVGNPIRKEIIEGNAQEAEKLFNITLTRPVILVMGGSQGAEALNDFVLQVLNDLLKEYEVIHITGSLNIKQVISEAQVVIDNDLDKYYHPVGFLDEVKIKHAYKIADLIISRSGSGSIFEIAAVGKPSILIPLPGSAFEHQLKNAYAYAGTGAAVVIEQENLTYHFFMDQLKMIFLYPEKLQAMGKSAKAFAKPMAARTIAREILEFLMID